MFVQFNGNPCGTNTGDCVVRAISIVTGKSWQIVYCGLCVEGFMKCTWGNANNVWADYLANLGFQKMKLPDSQKYTVSAFANDHKDGKYILGTGNHAVAVMDGNYVDSWDSGSENVLYYFYRE